jgi:sarcosine oxidase subunit gamma
VANVELQTPLNGQAFSIEGLSLTELPSCSKISMRGDVDAMSAAVEAVAGVSAVSGANRFSVASGNAGDNTLYWMGPDERLLHSTNSDAPAVVKALKEKLPAGKSAVVDVSDYYTVLHMSGEKARDVLASGTPFDVHPDIFRQGDCAQIRFGSASILLACVGDASYDLQVRWSFAEYLWKYLCKVARYV